MKIGMPCGGTALLNGRNPTTYLEAIKRLRDAKDVGRMDWVCFATGIKMAEGWGHHYKLIDTVAMELEKGIVENNGCLEQFILCQ